MWIEEGGKRRRKRNEGKKERKGGESCAPIEIFKSQKSAPITPTDYRNPSLVSPDSPSTLNPAPVRPVPFIFCLGAALCSQPQCVPAQLDQLSNRHGPLVDTSQESGQQSNPCMTPRSLVRYATPRDNNMIFFANDSKLA